MWGVLELQNGKPADFLQRRSNSIKLKKSYHLGRIISGISHSITITPSLQNGSPLHKWQNRVLEFHCQLTNFLYKMSPHYIMTEQGPLNSIVNIPIFINFLYKMSPHYKMKEQGSQCQSIWGFHLHLVASWVGIWCTTRNVIYVFSELPSHQQPFFEKIC